MYIIQIIFVFGVLSVSSIVYLAGVTVFFLTFLPRSPTQRRFDWGCKDLFMGAGIGGALAFFWALLLMTPKLPP